MKVSAAVAPAVPSATFGASMDSTGGSSSSVISPCAVPAPSAVETVALVGAPSVTVTVSSSSSVVSPLTGMTMSALVEPGAMLTDCAAGAVKSSPETASPPRVNGAVTVLPLAADRLTVNRMFVAVPGSSPSVTADASATARLGSGSSSIIVMVAGVASIPVGLPEMLMVSSSSSSASLVGVSVNVALPLTLFLPMVISGDAGETA